MQYAYYDLGEQKENATVEITLSSAANVQLLDTANYDLFRHHQEHKSIGQYVYLSPHRITIPEKRHWYVAIEAPGEMTHSVRILPATA